MCIPCHFSDLAITTIANGDTSFIYAVESVARAYRFCFRLANVSIVFPHYSSISRRAKQVEVSFKPKPRGAIQHFSD
ncbi:transposase [Vibrio vulnificus]|nr:transposase [Vibrio vulnificus]TMX71490.1 hypothetical protein DA097_03570 [Vibrio rotiferianus]